MEQRQNGSAAYRRNPPKRAQLLRCFYAPILFSHSRTTIAHGRTYHQKWLHTPRRVRRPSLVSKTVTGGSVGRGFKSLPLRSHSFPRVSARAESRRLNSPRLVTAVLSRRRASFRPVMNVPPRTCRLFAQLQLVGGDELGFVDALVRQTGALLSLSNGGLGVALEEAEALLLARDEGRAEVADRCAFRGQLGRGLLRGARGSRKLLAREPR
jgi:hypothetical protein